MIQYATGDGKDTVIGFGGSDSIEVTSGAIGTPKQSGNNVLITVGSGSTNVITLKDTKVNDVQINDNFITIEKNPFPVTLTSGHDNENYTVEGATVDAAAGNDTITNSGSNSSIYGNAGKDIITNSGINSTIDGGADNDTIYIEGEATGVIVIGGKGNDLITTNNNGNLIKYATGDGIDTIEGFGENDSIEVTSGSIRASADNTDGRNYKCYND